MGNNGSAKQIFIAADLTMPIATPKEPAEQPHCKEYFVALSHQCLRKTGGLLKGKSTHRWVGRLTEQHAHLTVNPIHETIGRSSPSCGLWCSSFIKTGNVVLLMFW